METQKPISKFNFDQFITVRYKNQTYEQAIEERVDYILKCVFEAGNSRLDNWWVSGANEGESGDIFSIIHKDYISVSCLEYDCTASDYDNFKAIINGETWNLLEDIPTRWLHEKFENELLSGVKLFRIEQENKKQLAATKRKANKVKKEKLIESARTKLTIEEQKAVGIFKK